MNDTLEILKARYVKNKPENYSTKHMEKSLVSANDISYKTHRSQSIWLNLQSVILQRYIDAIQIIYSMLYSSSEDEEQREFLEHLCKGQLLIGFSEYISYRLCSCIKKKTSSKS